MGGEEVSEWRRFRWTVKAFRADGLIYGETIHETELSKNLDVNTAKTWLERGDIAKYEVVDHEREITTFGLRADLWSPIAAAKK